MSQTNSPSVIEFEGSDWNALAEMLGKAIADEALIEDGYYEVDEDGEFIAVHEAKYARRDAKAARAQFAAKIRKEGRNA